MAKMFKVYWQALHLKMLESLYSVEKNIEKKSVDINLSRQREKINKNLHMKVFVVKKRLEILRNPKKFSNPLKWMEELKKLENYILQLQK